jgi:transcriptional regulator with XRE-family HTH domain
MLRTAEGLSQKALAEKLEVSRSYLSLVENEKKSPSLPFLNKAAEAFSIPPVLLFVDPKDEESELFIDLQKILGKVLAAKVHLTKAG